MAGQALSIESKFEQFAKERLGGLSSAIDCDLSEEELTEAVGKVSGHSSCRQMFYAVRDSYTGLEPVIEDIGNNRCLAAIRLNEIENINAILMIAVDGHVATVKPLLRSLVELYGLTQEIVTYRAALEESAMQLAQSFEEQNWLRSFARSASSFTDVSSANSMASGILQPLGYLLRAQDIYLIVEPSETERSGLTSTKFGGSNFRIHTIANLIESMGMHAAAPPLVRNRLEVQTNDGGIQSIIAVTIPSNGKNLGFLVGINRAAEMHDGLPVYDPEFGSGDVGLLEEAAVLLATQAHNVHLLVKSNQLFLGTLHAMSSAIDARDPYTQGHSERVARLSLELAKILGLSEVAQQEIYLSGILHDIGKIGIPDHVLLKNGPLNDEEYAIIKRHPEIGYRIVERLGQLKFALPGVLYHHERWDGRGYPHQLAGEAIPLMARIMAVADAFDAMTSSRPYRQAMPLEKAIRIITEGAGEQWDASIVACFKIWIEARMKEQGTQVPNSHSYIPLGTSTESIVQAVMVLGS